MLLKYTDDFPKQSRSLNPLVGDKAVNAEVQATFVMKKNLRMRKSKIRTKKHYIPKATVTNDNQP